MEVDRTISVEATDEAKEVSEESAEDCRNCGKRDLANQLERIREHRMQVYRNPNTVAAMLGGMFCNFAELEARLSYWARDALQENNLAADESGIKMGAFDVVIRLVTASMRLAEHANRLSCGESPSDATKSR